MPLTSNVDDHLEINKNMVEKIIGILAWPITILFISTLFMLIFRQPLSKLIGRVKEVSKEGIKTTSDNPQKVIEPDRAAVEELMRLFDSVALREFEKAIRKDLDDRGLTENTETVKILIRHLSAAQIQNLFERINSIIWGSQIKFLQELNSFTIPVPSERLRYFYDLASTNYPLVYENYSYENWLNFLVESKLIFKQDDGYLITQLGREFLTYLSAMGKTGFRPN